MSQKLHSQGHQVRVVDIEVNHRPSWLRSTEIFEGTGAALCGYLPDVVVHLASRTNMRSGEREGFAEVADSVVKLDADLRVIRDVAPEPTLVYFSSSAVYGTSDGPAFTEASRLAPISAYGAAKASCEMLLSAFCGTTGHKAIIVRPSTIVGGPMNRGVIPSLVWQAMHNQKIRFLGDGSQTRGFLHLEDVYHAIQLLVALECHDNISVYNIASAGTTDVATVAKIVGDFFGVKIETPNDAPPYGWVGDASRLPVSAAQLVQLGWQTTSSDEAVHRAVQELAEIGHVELRQEEQT